MKRAHLFSIATLLALPILATAQPDPNNVPKGDNPANRPVRVPPTPEQIQQRMQAAFKRQLEAANVTDEKEQTAVIAYATGEFAARQKLADASRALQNALRTPDATDAQIAGLLNDLQAAAADDKARRQKAQATLKQTIDVTQFPRLEAGLTLLGLYGDVPITGGGMNNMLGGNNKRPRKDPPATAKPTTPRQNPVPF